MIPLILNASIIDWRLRLANIMKITIVSILLTVVVIAGFLPVGTQAAVRVKSYYKPSTGRYVMPSYRSSPNRTRLDNWSIKGNINPYTGRRGTVNPYSFRFGW